MNENGSKLDRLFETRRRALEMLATSMGPGLKELLLDDLVIEIIRNPDGSVWAEKVGKGLYKTDVKTTDADAERVILLVARGCNAKCTPENPILSAEMPESGYRFEANISPVTTSPTFCIRKHASKIFSFEEYVEAKIMTESQVTHIKEAVKAKKNILVVGGTGSGKTTLVNTVLQEVAKTNDRLIIIEDTRELKCAAENYSSLRTSEAADMTRLLKSTMRQRPDRIIVGEVRGAEALVLMKAWYTGHPGGLGTLHANGTLEALYRIEQLIEEAGVQPSRQFIAGVINVIIFITKNKLMERKVEDIKSVVGLDKDNQYILQDV